MSKSEQLFEQAQRYIPGGVNSPVRAFKGVGGTPIFFRSASGPHLIDEDGQRYIDYVGSWGPMIVGHAHPKVIAAVTESAANGLSFGTPTEAETRLAELLCRHVGALDQVRMCNSGTEATMSALRLARGYTGRNKIIKFEGCYHGHSDCLLVKAGSGALTLGVPTSPGVPADVVSDTITLPFNGLDQVRETCNQLAHEVACIIVEPVAGNMNCVPPVDGFLQGLREVCDQHGIVLIFDEVMTGFRIALGGAQEVFGVQPDMVALGKVIGGGMPVGAFGGRAEIMASLAPLGPVYQAGTLSGNPVAMAAGIATLELISEPGFFAALGEKTQRFCEAMRQTAQNAGVALTTNSVGGMFGLFFSAETVPIRHYAQVMDCDVERFKRFFHGMLAQGVYFAPSAFESGFVSAAHSQEDLDRTVAAATEVFASLD